MYKILSSERPRVFGKVMHLCLSNRGKDAPSTKSRRNRHGVPQGEFLLSRLFIPMMKSHARGSNQTSSSGHSDDVISEETEMQYQLWPVNATQIHPSKRRGNASQLEGVCESSTP